MPPTVLPRSARLNAGVNSGLFFIASLLALCFLESAAGIPALLLAAVATTAIQRAAHAPFSAGRWPRVFGRLAGMANAGFHVLILFLAVVWESRLLWTMPRWSVAVAALLLAGAVATFRRPRDQLRIPIALPIGLVIAACLIGWRGAENYARCDDFERIRHQRGVELLFPSTARAAECAPGEILPLARYPRGVWEAPDGARYVVTTTKGDGRAPPPVYDGLFCELSADGAGRPRCVGGLSGKAHQVDEILGRDELFGCAWSLNTSKGRRESSVFRLTRDSPLAILGQRRFEGFAVYGFYQPKTDEYRFFSDECGAIRGLRGSDFSPLPDLSSLQCPGATVYDPDRDEGLMCGGARGFVAFHLLPWSMRDLGANDPTVRAWMSWGCDWDRSARKVYATVPNLGLLVVMDYDSGRVEQRHFVGFALRAVAVDAARRRVYLADFLAGEVLAVDASTGVEVRRWFAGHFIRHLRLSRDGKKLLTASNLGVVRIDLDAR